MLDEITLRRLYLEEQRSIRDIARLAKVPTRTVYDALIRYRIPRRPAGFHSPRATPANASLDEITLRRLYLDEERSIRDIATLHHISTRVVYDAMSRYRIPRRGQRTLCVTIVTTLLDPLRYPADAVAALYDRRWTVETHLAELKTTLRMRAVHCQTEAGVRKELAVYCLAYNLVHDHAGGRAAAGGGPLAHQLFGCRAMAAARRPRPRPRFR